MVSVMLLYYAVGPGNTNGRWEIEGLRLETLVTAWSPIRIRLSLVIWAVKAAALGKKMNIGKF